MINRLSWSWSDVETFRSTLDLDQFAQQDKTFTLMIIHSRLLDSMNESNDFLVTLEQNDKADKNVEAGVAHTSEPLMVVFTHS